jgi:hypothetical protein
MANSSTLVLERMLNLSRFNSAADLEGACLFGLAILNSCWHDLWKLRQILFFSTTKVLPKTAGPSR